MELAPGDRNPWYAKDHTEVIVSRFLLPLAQSGILADPLVLMALAVGILAVIYFLVRNRRSAAGPALPPSIEPSRQQIQALLQELDDASQHMSAQIDAKAARLEALIADADARSASLSAILARAKAQNIAQKLIAGVAEHGESGLGALARHREIYDLADSGHSPAAIAQKLGRPCGEVELILALRGG